MRFDMFSLVLIFFSKLFNPHSLRVCRFEPTCSCYAKDAFNKHRPLFAARLVMRRLLRCRPFGGAGYDPAE